MPVADQQDSSEAESRRRFTFPRHYRVLRSADFTRGMRQGRRTSDGRLTMWAVANELPHPRLGLMVGRQHGNAPARNLLKRRLREAFRLSQHELPSGYDFLVRVRVGKTPTTADCQQSLLTLANRLHRQLSKFTADCNPVDDTGTQRD